MYDNTNKLTCMASTCEMSCSSGSTLLSNPRLTVIGSAGMRPLSACTDADWTSCHLSGAMSCFFG